MGYVHQDIVSNYHWHQVMANAMAGGYGAINATGASNAIGGFAVTGTTNGHCKATYQAFSGTPVVIANAHGTGSGQTNIRVVPYGIDASSCGFRGLNTGNGTTNVKFIAVVFGMGTGTNHS